MPNVPTNIQNISLTIDGNTVVPKTDITNISCESLLPDVYTEKTFGDPILTLSSQDSIQVSVTIGGNTKGHDILTELHKEATSSAGAQYHTLSLFNGAKTTIFYEDALLREVTPNIDRDGTMTTTFSFVARKAKV
jgi:hypothetical protein